MATTLSSGLPAEFLDQQEVELDIRAGYDWLKLVSIVGYKEPTHEEKELYISYKGKVVVMQKVRAFFPASFVGVLNQIEGKVFDFASRALVQLQFGDFLSDEWSALRKTVDAKLHELGFQDHLDGIREGMASDNPEIIRASVFACRNLMRDLADHLWQDPRKTYEHLKGQGKDGKLQVTSDDTKNRYAAYLHQKGLHGKKGAHVKEDQERLWSSLKSLIEQQSQGHAPIAKQEANFVAIKTYLMIGELIGKTDMLPVVNMEIQPLTSETKHPTSIYLMLDF